MDAVQRFGIGVAIATGHGVVPHPELAVLAQHGSVQVGSGRSGFPGLVRPDHLIGGVLLRLVEDTLDTLAAVDHQRIEEQAAVLGLSQRGGEPDQDRESGTHGESLRRPSTRPKPAQAPLRQ
jgi:hypothetical protein